MNRTGPGIISADLRASIGADLLSLFTDPDVPRVVVEVTQPYAAPAIDRAAGTVTAAADTSSASALRGEVTLQEVAQAQGGLQVGDIRFQLLRSELSRTPTMADRLREGDDRYTTLSVSTDPLGLSVTYTCRRSP